MAIDSGTETQVVQGLKGRSIYEASTGEIAWKSFLAGMFLGLGKTIGSVVIWAIFLFFSLQLLLPFITPMLAQFQTITDLLQQQQDLQQNAGSGNFEQIFQQLNGTRTQ